MPRQEMVFVVVVVVVPIRRFLVFNLKRSYPFHKKNIYIENS